MQNKEKSNKRQSGIKEYFQVKKCRDPNCKHTSSSEDSNLVVCEICDDTYHWYCTQTLESLPHDNYEFFCIIC
jgi:hypothetical protein